MKTLILSLTALILVLGGCVPPQMPFYWGDYSNTLYGYKKTPDDKTFAEHKQSLLVIITDSPKKKLGVPPGVHAELGYMLILEGKEKEGLEHLDREVTLFPESRIFVERLKQAFKRGEQQ